MVKLGLKLFSTNTNLCKDATRLLDAGLFAYIELYVPPHTFADTCAVWQSLACPFIIHAPHFKHGVNLSDPALAAQNRELLADSFRFADALHAPHIIVHSGFGGTVESMCQQAKALQDTRLVLENTPVEGTGGQACTVYSPAHIAAAMASGAFGGSVLDFGHALCAANALGIAPMPFVEEYMALRPALYHISDGHYQGVRDVHLGIGEGDFPLAQLLALLPSSSAAHTLLTLETPRQNMYSLSEAEKDAHALLALLKKDAL